MPPAPLRRPLTVTVWLLVSIAFIALSPIALGISEVIATITGDRRPALATRVALTYFTRELVTLVACGGIWLLAGCGVLMGTPRIQAVHWRLLRWFASGIADKVLDTLEISVVEEESQVACDAMRADGPIIVLSRHAGPADTLLMVSRLLSRFDRRPSVVFKEAIALDPSVDLIAHRLPHAVLDVDDPPEAEARIARTAAALGPRGALLLYPEGGNFTPERRQKAFRSLLRRRHRHAAQMAQAMQHVLPPRPAGTIAALRANPDADVIFAAHTGLGLAAYPREIWNAMPTGGTFRTRLWLVPRTDVPAGQDEDITRWLTDWWLRIDHWIDGKGDEEVSSLLPEEPSA